MLAFYEVGNLGTYCVLIQLEPLFFVPIFKIPLLCLSSGTSAGREYTPAPGQMQATEQKRRRGKTEETE